MKPHIKKRLIRTLIFSILAFVIGGGVAFMQMKLQKATILKPGESAPSSPVAGLSIGGPFTLNDHNGEKVTQDILKDHYTLIYFGFTYCPAICPTELQKISRVMKGVEKNVPEKAQNLQLLFVTIDPDRDTVPVIKDYISLFHPKMVGLTGTQPQISQISKAYRIFARKVREEGMDEDEYTMDHSSYIYLMGPDGQLAAIYRTKDSADFIYDDVAKKLNLPK